MQGFGVKETTTTTGTGTLTLSAVTDWVRVSQAFAVGAYVEYSILNSAGAPIETGIGQVGVSNTLLRTYPMATYVSGTYDSTTPSAVNLAAGTYYVIVTGTPGSRFAAIPGMNANATYTAIDSGHFSGNNSLTAALTTNRLYMVPFRLDAIRPMAGIQCRVSVAGGTFGSMGLYRMGPDGLPSELLQSGTFSTVGTGIKQVSFSAYYPPDWYCTALVVDGAVTCNTTSVIPGSSPFGHDTNNQHITCLYTANGSITLPNPWVYSGVTPLVNSTLFPTVSIILA